MKTRVMILRTTALAALVALALTAPAFAQLDLPRPSPKATISQQVGLTDVRSPTTGRASRGARSGAPFVPYGEVWRTGANEATTITFSTDVTVQGQPGRGRHLRPVHDPRQGRVDGDPQQGRQAVGRVRLQEGRRRAALHGQAAGGSVRGADEPSRSRTPAPTRPRSRSTGKGADLVHRQGRRRRQGARRRPPRR